MLPAGLNHLAWSEAFGSSRPSSVHVQLTNPNDSDVSTLDTIGLMRLHSDQDAYRPELADAEDDIRRMAGGESDEELVEATHQWMKDHVTFVQDEELTKRLFGIPDGVELLITPARLLTMPRPMGDCDDFSTTVRALLKRMGIGSGFVTVGADRANPRKWSHVYNMAQLEDGRQVPVDASHGDYVGWEAPRVSRKGVWGDGDRLNEIPLGEENGMYVSHSGRGMRGLGIDWNAILDPISKASSTILTARYATPQLSPGTYIQRGPNGEIITNQPFPGGGINMNPLGTGVGGSTTTLLIGGVVVIGALALLMGRR